MLSFLALPIKLRKWQGYAAKLEFNAGKVHRATKAVTHPQSNQLWMY
jgi:hypothetical protein